MSPYPKILSLCNLLPAGCRNYGGEFITQGKWGAWWTIKEENEYVAMYWMLSYNSGIASPGWKSKRYGLSVRCMMDNPMKGSQTSSEGRYTNKAALNRLDRGDNTDLMRASISDNNQSVIITEKIVIPYEGVLREVFAIEEYRLIGEGKSLTLIHNLPEQDFWPVPKDERNELFFYDRLE